MAIDIGDLFKHEKLKIESYQESDRSDALTDDKTFIAMFNPESYSRSYKNVFGAWDENRERSYTTKLPAKMSFKLILDNTGVTEWGFMNIISAFGGDSNDVPTRVQKFLTLTTILDPDIHQPRYLTLKWGDALSFNCRLLSVNVNYTLFNESGNPIRAELDTIFVADDWEEEPPVASPDMTHRRTVKAGDNLLLLTADIYGSSAYYLKVAEVNGLDDFRNLEPGKELIFPPLEK